jgi:hypothetical protein
MLLCLFPQHDSRQRYLTSTFHLLLIFFFFFFFSSLILPLPLHIYSHLDQINQGQFIMSSRRIRDRSNESMNPPWLGSGPAFQQDEIHYTPKRRVVSNNGRASSKVRASSKARKANVYDPEPETEPASIFMRLTNIFLLAFFLWSIWQIVGYKPIEQSLCVSSIKPKLGPVTTKQQEHNALATIEQPLCVSCIKPQLGPVTTKQQEHNALVTIEKQASESLVTTTIYGPPPTSNSPSTLKARTITVTVEPRRRPSEAKTGFNLFSSKSSSPLPKAMAQIIAAKKTRFDLGQNIPDRSLLIERLRSAFEHLDSRGLNNDYYNMTQKMRTRQVVVPM